MTFAPVAPPDIYLPDDDLLIAAEVAMELGQPLLLTGEPGTGKTTFARHLARTVAPRFFAGRDGTPSTPMSLHTFETKSTSVSTDLFYRYDSLRRFQAVHDHAMSSDNRDYIVFEALGRALLESLPSPDVMDFMARDYTHPGPRRSVVLIDEVDKAPRDFPNDILNEIEDHFFRIPELAGNGRGVPRIAADPRLRPVILLTSNSEKNLPAPFLRRCVFHHIRFPDRTDGKRLKAIVRANLAQATGRLADSAIDFFYDVREAQQLDKRPTSHELVQWIRILHDRQWGFAAGVDPGQLSLRDLPLPVVSATLGVIAKTTHDLKVVEQLLNAVVASSRTS